MNAKSGHIDLPCAEYSLASQILNNNNVCISKYEHSKSCVRTPFDFNTDNNHFSTSFVTNCADFMTLPYARILLSKMLRYDNVSPISNIDTETFVEMPEIDGLGARFNKSLNFIIMDSEKYPFVAENLGIDIKAQDGTGVAIVDIQVISGFDNV